MRSTSFCVLLVAVSAMALAEEVSTDAIEKPPLASSSSSSPADASHRTAHQTGKASYYSRHLQGRRTASGQPYDPNALTAAHRTLPLGTKLEVVNPKNDRRVVVTVNDRGPVPKDRVLDVSSAAADALDMKKSGVTRVRTRVVGQGDAPAEATAGDEATTTTTTTTDARR